MKEKENIKETFKIKKVIIIKIIKVIKMRNQIFYSTTIDR